MIENFRLNLPRKTARAILSYSIKGVIPTSVIQNIRFTFEHVSQ